jgi:hypothetical protein
MQEQQFCRSIAATRIANNAIVANMGAINTFIERRKDDVKGFSKIAANTVKTFEDIKRYC